MVHPGNHPQRRLRALVAPATLRPAWRLALPIVALLLFAVLLMAPHPVLANDGAHATDMPGMVAR